MLKQATLRAVHPFPARMAPSIALEELPTKKSYTILDPMAGSGTTLVTARLKGHRALGFDIDPLAVLMAGVWSSSIDAEAVRRQFETTLAKAAVYYKATPAKDAYPKYADKKTKEFIRFWFDTDNRKQLTALTRAIQLVKDQPTQDLFWCAFSRLIITKARGVSLAMDVSHSRPHRKFKKAPIRAFDAIERQFNTIIKNSPFLNAPELPEASAARGDARKLPLADNSVDAVITSPPYLNAIDYMRGHKLALVWMGHTTDELRSIRSGSVGAEAALSATISHLEADQVLKQLRIPKKTLKRTRNIVTRYITDMDGVMSEITRVTKKNGRIVFVVGDSTLHGVFIKNSSIVKILGQKYGLKLLSYRKRPLPENRRYLPAPKSAKAGAALAKRMNEEVIICFAK